MPLFDVDWSPEPRKLKVFAVGFAVFAGLLGLYLWGGLGVPVAVAAALWAAGALVLLAGFVRPVWVRPVYVGLTAVALPIGLVLATLILALVYYLLLTPIGLLGRLFRRDRLGRRLDPETGSYWVSRTPDTDVKRYFRQS